VDKNLNFTLSKYKKNGLSTLKKFISTQNFYNFYIRKGLRSWTKFFKMERTNLNTVRRVITLKICLELIYLRR